MAQVVTLMRPRHITIETLADPPLAPHEVRVATLYSGISAGTELAAFRGTSPHLAKRWDARQRLFRPDRPAGSAYPLRNLGYEEVGRVVELGSSVDDLVEGELVYGSWGHRSHHVMDAAAAAARRLPDGLEPRLGIFSHIGAVALNGVHDARIRIGETVAVYGLGVPGQIVAQLARRSGARVLGVDPIASRRALAASLRAIDVGLDPSAGSPAEAIKDLTEGRGADVSLEVSGVTTALHEAIRGSAYAAKVVAMGFYQGEARQLALGDEFHHNRVTVVSSQVSGVDPELSYRWDKARLAASAMALQADGTLDLGPLVTHDLPFADAAAAFDLLDRTPAEALQVVLRFPEADA